MAPDAHIPLLQPLNGAPHPISTDLSSPRPTSSDSDPLPTGLSNMTKEVKRHTNYKKYYFKHFHFCPQPPAATLIGKLEGFT